MSATACFCLPLPQAVKFIALICIGMGFSVVAASSWVLHKSMQMKKNPTLVTAEDLLRQVNTFYGGTTGLYDLHVIFRILIICSATALMGGIVQFCMSLWLLMSSSKRSRALATFWVIVMIVVMMAIGGSFLCIMTNELEISLALKVFLPVTGIDFILLIYFTWVVFAFSRGPEFDL